MLKGRLVGLREYRREDVSTLFPPELDPEYMSLTEIQPYRPRPLAAHLAEYDRRIGEQDSRSVPFAIQRLDDESGAAIGRVGLWSIDLHQRTAHIGISLLPSAQGQGYGRDARRGDLPVRLRAPRPRAAVAGDAVRQRGRCRRRRWRAGSWRRAGCAAPPGTWGTGSTRWSTACSPTSGGSDGDEPGALSSSRLANVIVPVPFARGFERHRDVDCSNAAPAPSVTPRQRSGKG